MLDYKPSELRELYRRLYPKRKWDGRCRACGHDFFAYCQGNCTCRWCNEQRRYIERDKQYPTRLAFCAYCKGETMHRIVDPTINDEGTGEKLICAVCGSARIGYIWGFDANLM
jgi:hypothetical protein